MAKLRTAAKLASWSAAARGSTGAADCWAGRQTSTGRSRRARRGWVRTAVAGRVALILVLAWGVIGAAADPGVEFVRREVWFHGPSVANGAAARGEGLTWDEVRPTASAPLV